MSRESASSSDPGRGMDVEALHFIAEGVTALAGFDLAAISIVEGDCFRVVAVAGSSEASAELMALRSPIDRVLAELAAAERTGRMMFVRQESASDQLDGFSWIPDYEIVDGDEAWLPEDLLCALLHDDGGELRGLLSVDLPTGRRRPGKAALDILNVYARQAERAVVNFLEREQFATDLALERRVSRYRSHLINIFVPRPADTRNRHPRTRGACARRCDRPAVAGRSPGHQPRGTNLGHVARPARHGPGRRSRQSRRRGRRRPCCACDRLRPTARRDGFASTNRSRLLVPDRPVYVIGSSVELEAMVGNLLSNAVKYSDPGGLVRLAVSDESPGGSC